jgi:hypothetical protein
MFKTTTATSGDSVNVPTRYPDRAAYEAALVERLATLLAAAWRRRHQSSTAGTNDAHAADTGAEQDLATPVITPTAPASPWLTLTKAAAYAKRGKRSLAREVKCGRLRAAAVGGRRQLLFRVEWLDAWLEDQATPVMVTPRRRA